MKKNIIIIGGGITGCVAAMSLDARKFNITIYEQKKQLGGILNDFVNEGELFFNGCQYFDPSQKWYKKLYKFFNENLKSFDHQYASLTEHKKIKIFNEDYAMPVFPKLKNKIKLNKLKANNLKNRINKYPKIISNFLFDYLKKFNLDYNVFGSQNAVNVHISRVAIDGYEKELLILKKNSNFDELFGVKRKFLFAKKKLKAATPERGYNNFFDQFEKILLKKKIKINLRSPVDPFWKNGKLFLEIKKSETITADYIIWTGNPTKLVYKSIKKKLDSVPIKIVQYSINTTKSLKNRYVQIFSPQSNCLRFYSYKIRNKNKISVECVFEKKNDILVKQEINALLKDMQINYIIDKEKIFRNSSIRFSLVTENDSRLFSKLKRQSKKSNLICGPWEIYGRDKKIDYILDKTSKL